MKKERRKEGRRERKTNAIKSIKFICVSYAIRSLKSVEIFAPNCQFFFCCLLLLLSSSTTFLLPERLAPKICKILVRQLIFRRKTQAKNLQEFVSFAFFTENKKKKNRIGLNRGIFLDRAWRQKNSKRIVCIDLKKDEYALPGNNQIVSYAVYTC